MGVKVIAVHRNQIVLVHPKYSAFWHLPGGGVKKGETVVEAAKREFNEECGIKNINLKLAAIYSNFSEGKNDHIAVFSTQLESVNLYPSMEIEECRLFDLGDLPAVSPGSNRRIADYKLNKFVSGLW